MDDGNLLNILHAKLFIFLEDDFHFIDEKTSIIYSFSRMDSRDRKILLNDIKNLDEGAFSSLNQFSEMISSWFPLIANWNEATAIDDFEGIFQFLLEKKYPCFAKLKDIYEEIDLSSLIDSCGDLFIKYGVSISVPSYYNTIFFNNYIRKNSEWKPIRVYTDFGEDTKRHLLETFDAYSIKDTGDTIICLVDNYLKGGEQEAQNIINSLSKYNSKSRANIIGAIFTSRNDVNDKFDDEIFIETIKKEEPSALIKSLIKSSYSYFLSMYKNEMISAIDKSFSKLLSRKDIIPYLSKMAYSEGISNYQILTEWFELLNNYQSARSPFLPDLLRLSNILSFISDEDAVTDSIDDDLLELNSFELFDCYIDNYYLPTMPGDVFCNSKNDVYILVGQECDYMMAEKRKRNNLICELVKAEAINIESIKKIKNDLEYIYINDFKYEDNICCLKIDYTSRHMIDNEIINLCSFNKTGECKINLMENLTNEHIELMQHFLVGYHQKLQGYYKSLVEILNVASVEDFFNDYYKKSKLINIKDYKKNGNEISFDLKRIGRLNGGFMLYLNKLFSEYRGRHPYNSINLSRYEFFDMHGKINDNDMDISNVVCLLPIMKDKHRPEDLHKFSWYIPTETLQLELRKNDKDIKINLNKDYLYVRGDSIDIPLKDSKKRLMLRKMKGPGFEIKFEDK